MFERHMLGLEQYKSKIIVSLVLRDFLLFLRIWEFYKGSPASIKVASLVSYIYLYQPFDFLLSLKVYPSKYLVRVL